MRNLPTLLTAKLTIPPPGPDSVERPDLCARLSAGLAGRVTLVVAPAGYGKTTLVSQWLAALQVANHSPRVRCAWLALDADENTPHRFLHYFFAAWQSLAPEAAATGEALLQPPHPAPPRVALSAFLNELAALTTRQPALHRLLVIEDYHLIQNPQLHAALAFVVDHLPVQAHLLLLSRQAPPLPLARWRARRQLTELTMADLRFSVEETRQLVAQRHPATAQEFAEQLNEQTEGWPAAIQLTLLANAAHPTPQTSVQRPGELDPLLADYLLQEVYQTLPPAMRGFLCHCAILDRLSAPLCGALLADEGAGLQLEQLARDGLLISRLDDAGRWYRLHPLWREFLLGQLQQTDPATIATLHQRAMSWFAAHGQLEAAIHHALAAGDTSTAAQLLATLVSPLLHQGDLVSVQGWLERLPAAEVLANPRLCLTQVWVLLDAYHLAEAAPFLNQLRTYIGATDEAALHAEMLAILAVASAMEHRPAAALTLARSAEEAAASSASVLPYVAFGLGAAYRMSYEPVRAEEAFRQAAAGAAAQCNHYIAGSAWGNLAALYLETGRLADAERAHERLLQLLRIAPGVEKPDAGLNYLELARIYYERNRLDAAATALERSIRLCSEWENYQALVRAQLVQSQLFQARRAFAEAQNTLEAADHHARQSADPQLVQSVIRRWVALALAQGERSRAQQWAERLSTDGPYTFLTGLTLARLALAGDEPGRALDYLTGCWQQIAKLPLFAVQVHTLALQALAHAALRQSNQANRLLQQALNMGQSSGLVRTLIDLGAALETLLRTAPISPASRDYVAELLGALASECTDPVTSGLTPREQEILYLLAAGLSNRQMAERLVISEGTLKRHVSNLYLKLAVHSRTEALHCAAGLGLLARS